ncbi:MAG: TatD family hydrolase [Chlorobi bacterium]|nr:TatD family hydrolase [Chlorobiota bacterium]
MSLTDTHAHLYLPEFDNDREVVIQTALDAGVERIFLPNINLSTLNPMLTLCQKYERNLWPMIGLHPSSVRTDYDSTLQKLESVLKTRQFIAVGETGIDLYWDKTFRNEQMAAFRTQIKWAIHYQLPVVIHSRESFDEIFSVIDEFRDQPLTGVFHSFTGSLNQARHAIDLGFLIGIGGIVTFRNSDLKTVLKQIDPQHIILETDAPYLAPVPKRGKRNECSFLIHTARFVADLYGMNEKLFIDLTTQNALRLFNHAK